MKLGLIYKEIGHGANDIFPTVNGGEWCKPSNFIKELTDQLAIEGIRYDDTATVGIGFKYVSEGLLICIAQRISVRGDSRRSYKSLWIHVPTEVSLSATQFEALIRVTEEMLRNEQAFISPDDFSMAVPPIFHENFEATPYTDNKGSMQGSETAVIDCNGNFKPADVFVYGPQKIYEKYGFIALNRNGNHIVSAPVISTNDIKNLIWILPPVNVHVENASGASLLIDGEPFPAAGKKMTPGVYDITLQKQGFLPLEGKITVSSQEKGKNMIVPPGTFRDAKWYKRFDVYRIKVTNEKGKNLTEDCEFSSTEAYDKKREKLLKFSSDKSIYIPYALFGNFPIKVTCKGYETKSERLNLSQAKSEINITLTKISDTKPKEKEKDYTYKAVNTNGSLAGGAIGRAGYQGSTDRIYSEQINKLNEEIYRLKKSAAESKKKIALLWGCIGLLLGGAITFLCLWLTHDCKTQDDTTIPVTVPVTDNAGAVSAPQGADGAKNGNDIPTQVPVQLTPQALGYLDAVLYTAQTPNVAWKKDELEKYPELAGLFDDLNNYKFTRILEYWEPLLNQSKNFSEITQTIRKNIGNGWEQSGLSYARPGDNTITISSYIGKIKEKPTPSGAQVVSSPSNQTQTPGNTTAKPVKPTPGSASSVGTPGNGSSNAGTGSRAGGNSAGNSGGGNAGGNTNVGNGNL